MPSYAFTTVDVFTDRRFGGNPLAVITDARGLEESALQAIAREFNLSETVFVLPPENPAHTARLRIFTPKVELPFAGHPTIGAAYVLATAQPDLGTRLVFEQLAGPVAVEIVRAPSGAVLTAEMTAPDGLTLGIRLKAAELAACVALPETAIRLAEHPPVQAGVGIPVIIAELHTQADLADASPVIAAFQALAASYPELGAQPAIHLYVRDEQIAGRLHARMFAPLLGVPEDPATGSANATLAALLTSLAAGEAITLGFEIWQGDAMGRPSRIAATGRKTADGNVTATIVGGCVPVMRGTLDI